jgi:hypothetical protein
MTAAYHLFIRQTVKHGGRLPGNPSLLRCSGKTGAFNANRPMNDIGKSLRNVDSDSHRSPVFVEAERTKAHERQRNTW